MTIVPSTNRNGKSTRSQPVKRRVDTRHFCGGCGHPREEHDLEAGRCQATTACDCRAYQRGQQAMCAACGHPAPLHPDDADSALNCTAPGCRCQGWRPKQAATLAALQHEPPAANVTATTTTFSLTLGSQQAHGTVTADQRQSLAIRLTRARGIEILLGPHLPEN